MMDKLCAGLEGSFIPGSVLIVLVFFGCIFEFVFLAWDDLAGYVQGWRGAWFQVVCS